MSQCAHGKWEGACNICKPIHVSKDQTWNFKHPTLGYINSKGGFDRKCKEAGLVRVCEDDLVTRGNPTKPADIKVDKKAIGAIYNDIRQQSKNPQLVEQKWRETQKKVSEPISPVGVDYAERG